MDLFAKIKGKTARIRTNLTSLDNQPLSKAALIVILFLDIFILTSIFNGLDEHTRQLSSPDDYIPYSCREIVLNRDWNPTNRIDNLSQIVLSYNNSYYQVLERKKGRHPVCAPYLELLDQIKNDKELSNAFEDRNGFANETKDLQREINNLKGAYDTYLLETKKDVQAKTGALNTLKGQIAALEQKIGAHEKVRLLWAKLEALQQADREKLREDLRSMYFWFPVKRLAMQLVFLLPLFAIFSAWNSWSLGKNRGIQTLVSAHLLVVAFIPIFFKLIEMVYDIIPKKLLKKLIDLLESLNLVALWHYLVIAAAIAVALFVIYIFQKKLFSREKLSERRISRGQCQQCGRRLPAGSQACPFCGFAQFKACGNCKRPAHVYGKFCRECGTAL